MSLSPQQWVQGGSCVDFLLKSCIAGFICDICFVIVCSSFLLLLVPLLVIRLFLANLFLLQIQAFSTTACFGKSVCFYPYLERSDKLNYNCDGHLSYFFIYFFSGCCWISTFIIILLRETQKYTLINPQPFEVPVPTNSNKCIVIMYCYRVQLLWTVFCVFLPGKLLKWYLSRALDKALSLIQNVFVFSGFSTKNICG